MAPPTAGAYAVSGRAFIERADERLQAVLATHVSALEAAVARAVADIAAKSQAARATLKRPAAAVDEEALQKPVEPPAEQRTVVRRRGRLQKTPEPEIVSAPVRELTNSMPTDSVAEVLQGSSVSALISEIAPVDPLSQQSNVSSEATQGSILELAKRRRGRPARSAPLQTKQALQPLVTEALAPAITENPTVERRADSGLTAATVSLSPAVEPPAKRMRGRQRRADPLPAAARDLSVGPEAPDVFSSAENVPSRVATNPSTATVADKQLDMSSGAVEQSATPTVPVVQHSPAKAAASEPVTTVRRRGRPRKNALITAEQETESAISSLMSLADEADGRPIAAASVVSVEPLSSPLKSPTGRAARAVDTASPSVGRMSGPVMLDDAIRLALGPMAGSTPSASVPAPLQRSVFATAPKPAPQPPSAAEETLIASAESKTTATPPTAAVQAPVIPPAPQPTLQAAPVPAPQSVSSTVSSAATGAAKVPAAESPLSRARRMDAENTWRQRQLAEYSRSQQRPQHAPVVSSTLSEHVSRSLSAISSASSGREASFAAAAPAIADEPMPAAMNLPLSFDVESAPAPSASATPSSSTGASGAIAAPAPSAVPEEDDERRGRARQPEKRIGVIQRAQQAKADLTGKAAGAASSASVTASQVRASFFSTLRPPTEPSAPSVFAAPAAMSTPVKDESVFRLPHPKSRTPVRPGTRGMNQGSPVAHADSPLPPKTPAVLSAPAAATPSSDNDTLVAPVLASDSLAAAGSTAGGAGASASAQSSAPADHAAGAQARAAPPPASSRPEWAHTPVVTRQLHVQQRSMKPEDIFGPIQPVKLEDFFRASGKTYPRGRNSGIFPK